MADADVLAHIHIPKTAGTSVRVWLFRANAQGFGSFYPNYDFDEASLAAAGLGDRRLRAFSTHNMRRFPAECCGRTMRYFTILRDPIDQYLSYVTYMRQIANSPDGPPLDHLPRDMARLSTRDFTAWILEHPEQFRAHENPQTNFIAEHTWRQRALDATDIEAFHRERLGVAKEILRTFAAVGTVERLDESLELLRQRSAAWGFALLPPQAIGRDNVTETPRDDVSWIGEHDDVGRRLLASMADDRKLHAFADQLLTEATGIARSNPTA